MAFVEQSREGLWVLHVKSRGRKEGRPWVKQGMDWMGRTWITGSIEPTNLYMHPPDLAATAPTVELQDYWVLKIGHPQNYLD